MAFRIELDFSHDCTLGHFFKSIEPYQAKISRYVAEGPGGGNPCVWLDFPTHELALKYGVDHFQGESESWINTLIVETPKPVGLDENIGSISILSSF